MNETRKKLTGIASWILSLMMVQGAIQPAVIPAFAEKNSNSSKAEQSETLIRLKNISADADTSAYTVASFGNDYSELTRIAAAGVKVNGTKLNYNKNYSSLYYVNKGDCIVTGGTIQFHSSLLDEGENTIEFSSPDGGEDTVIKVNMRKVEVPPKYWYESTSYEYIVEMVSSEVQQDAYVVTWKNGGSIIETDLNVKAGEEPYYDGDVPVKISDDGTVYTFVGWADSEDGDVLSELPTVNGDVTYYAVFVKSEEPETEQQLYVRINGHFEHKLVGQQDDVDAVSSATTGGSSYYGSESTAQVEYALVDKGTSRKNVPESAWQKPDYFVNGDIIKVDGAKSKIIISPECDGVHGEINPFSGDLFLRGVPEKAGKYKVSVYLSTDKGDAVSNEVDYVVYSGDEKLIDRLTYDNCVKTADGKYMFDCEPWYIKDFGGKNETVTVPENIKAWFGSHAVLPEANYGEIGRTISLTNGEEPEQTLIIPNGCDLTMVNMRVHSGVKIIVQGGAKLTLRQSTVEGIIEVQSGGTFSMDYNDYGSGEWLYGSSINGQLRMKDGSILENTRIISHSNYTANDDENRRNSEPLVTTEGKVTVKGGVFILGEEAPNGETGQTALKVNGTLTVSEGSVLACYGGGASMLTADGGTAIELDNGTITGAGSLIAIGGYGMNITADTTKGSGGAAVSGNGVISTSKAYLEGGASFHDETAPIKGNVRFGNNTCRKLVTGKGNTTDKSEFYWFGTGDANGIIPQTDNILAQIPQNTVVSPAKNVYPKVTAVEYNEEFHQFRMKWTSVPDAEQYGIAVKLAGRWKVQAYTNAKTTVFTSPKLKAGSKYDIVVCAKVNGKWDISNIASRAVKVTVK
ncbi:MAG: InlB B-repeat-containing protein [Ruminococcus sp.]|uniref:hypothetical protein n=1 Tax=Ruminococcus sp. TaxID=41978 RepID=UPI0025D1F20A|nr:hypothetical protein [Ruminococcus sp.]MCR5540484.1 InlB B-repeat-containing protein [Ruminococcus sp.]